jgi:predicted ATPase/class 3 adenylate cyclase
LGRDTKLQDELKSNRRINRKPGMALPDTYIPMDRRRAIAQNRELPDRANGAVLFADISGFTPLTGALLKALGLKRGPEELTRQLNLVYDALITEVHRYGGSVIGFSGDAITCWFDGDDGRRATACGLSMQQAMAQFTAIETPTETTVSLGMKAAVAAGPVRRFLVGDPNIQNIDVLAGATLDRMAAAEQQAAKGEVVVTPEVVTGLGDLLEISEYRADAKTTLRLAVVSGLTQPVPPAPWPADGPELTDEQIRPWLLPPVFEQLKSGQGQFLAEIRPAVALFMRFGGLDYDGEDLAGPKLDFFIGWVQGVLVRHHGFLMQLTMGDKGSYLYAVFGAPITLGDDPMRAVAAALELHNPPPELEFAGPVQIGISRGRMRSGAYGGTTRQTYGVLGDEVNMAARLMARAEPGQIMISQSVAEVVTGDYLLQNLGLFKVKGKAEPIPVSLVLGRRRQTARQPVNLFPNPLVGRDAELTRLAQLLTAAAAGEGQLLRIQGEAGIGKSHLAAEFAQRALSQGWRVVLGTGHSTGRDMPYHPWRQIFRALFVLLDELFAGEVTDQKVAQQIEQVTNIVGGMNPDWLVRLPLLGDLLDLPVPDNATTAAFEPQLRQEALFSLAIDLIQQWARAQPLLILLEEAHWLDETSQDLTLAVARVISQAPTILAVVHRPPLDEGQPILSGLDPLANYHFLGLGELSPAGVGAAVAYRLPGAPSPLLLELIQLQARGNPFFVEELVDTLRELGHLTHQADGSWTLAEPVVAALRNAHCLRQNQAGQWTLDPDVPLSTADLGLPDSIHGLVLARLDRMAEAHKLTLKVASVIGRFFQFQLLAKAHPVERNEADLMRQVEELERRDFTRLETPLPQLAYIFKHNITRDVAYESLLERQQRELHRVVGEALEKLLPEAVEQLAYHYSRANVRHKSLFYLDKVARKAQREYANETALSYFRQALALKERWEWRKGQIEVLHILGHREEEHIALERLEISPDAPAFERAYLWGQYYEAIADYPAAQAAIEQALATARSNQDYLGEIDSLSQLGLIARRQGDYQTARNWYEQALVEFKERESYPSEEAYAFAQLLAGLTAIHLRQGELEAANFLSQRALDFSRANGLLRDEAQALNNLGLTAYRQRRLVDAVAFHQQALKIRQTIGNRADIGISLLNLSIATRDIGNYTQTEAYLTEAMAIQQAVGNRWEEINVWNDLGILYQELGDLTAAQAHLERGLALSREIGDKAGEAFLLCNLGLVLYDDGNLMGAEEVLTHGLVLARLQADKDLESGYLSYLSMVNLRANHLENAIEQAEAALVLRNELNLHLRTTDDLATLAMTHLMTGNLAQASTFAEQALTILQECDGEGPEFPQRDYLISYQVLAAVKQSERAQMALQSAYDSVMARANKITEPALRQSFLERVAVNRQIVAAYEKLIREE